MPSDRRWSDTDRELVAEALCIHRDSEVTWAEFVAKEPVATGFIRAGAERVLDALTTAGWRPGVGAALDKHLELHAARVRRETAEAIAAAIEASTDSGHYVGWRTLHAAIARATLTGEDRPHA